MAETRRDRRAPVSLKVRFKSVTIEQFLDQYSTDISKRGIFIKSRQPMDVGTLMKFEFQLKDETRIIQGIGRVVWKRTRDDVAGSPAAPGMGIKFIKMDAASRRFVQEIVDRREGRPGRFDEGMGTSATSGGSFFPPGASEPPPAEDATSIRHASEFLAEALSKANAATAKAAEQGAKKAREATARVQAHREAVDAARRAREDATGSIPTDGGLSKPPSVPAPTIPAAHGAPTFLPSAPTIPSGPGSFAAPPKRRQSAADVLAGVEVIPPGSRRDDTAELFLKRATIAPPGEEDEFAEAERIELARATKKRSRWTDPAAPLKQSSAPISDDDYLPVAKPKDLVKVDSLNSTQHGIGPKEALAPFDDEAETVVANSDKMTKLIESARATKTKAAEEAAALLPAANDKEAAVERATASLVNLGDIKDDAADVVSELKGAAEEKTGALATGLMGLVGAGLTDDDDVDPTEIVDSSVIAEATASAKASAERTKEAAAQKTTDVVSAGSAALDAAQENAAKVTDAVSKRTGAITEAVDAKVDATANKVTDVVAKATDITKDASKGALSAAEGGAAAASRFVGADAPPAQEESGSGWVKWLLLAAAIGLAFLAWTKLNGESTPAVDIEPTERLGEVTGAIGDGVANAAGAVAEGAGEVVEGAGEAGEAVGEAVAEAGEAVAEAGQAVAEAGQAAAEAGEELVEDGAAAVAEVVEEVVDETPTLVEPAPGVEMVNVQIASTPSGASLTVNGREVGRSPMVVELPADQVARVIVDADGYAAEEHTTTPRAGENNRLAVRLDALPFILEVQTTPGDARVMAYRSAFNAPGEIRLRPFARYVPVIITKNGYQRFRQRVLKEQFEERDGAMRYRLVVELEERTETRRAPRTTMRTRTTATTATTTTTAPTTTTTTMVTPMTTTTSPMTVVPDNPF